MASVIICDICKKPTAEIVGKLFYAPMTRSRSAKSFHNNYELHCDVGVCCEIRLRKGFTWRQRMSAKLYHARGKRKAS
jgi:hypothetical protein